MMTAVAGEIVDNKVITEQDLSAFNGNAVIVTILDNSFRSSQDRRAKRKTLFNAFAGGLKYIADDFDETPEGFEEYM